MSTTAFVATATLALALIVPPATAAPTATTPAGWTMKHVVTLPGSPERAYDAATGDIAPWWDHTFHDDPLRLVIEPWAGGGFWEIWNEQGEGVKHATVLWAERGRRLRFDGPLGFSGEAVQLVTTWDFAARGDSTDLTCTVNLAGTVDAKTAAGVEAVWRHFLTDRLKPWMEAGKDRGRKPLKRPS